jgi:hypothetical protein
MHESVTNKFRHDNAQWIASVGMISEGTDHSTITGLLPPQQSKN